MAVKFIYSGKADYAVPRNGDEITVEEATAIALIDMVEILNEMNSSLSIANARLEGIDKNTARGR